MTIRLLARGESKTDKTLLMHKEMKTFNGHSFIPDGLEALGVEDVEGLAPGERRVKRPTL